LVYNQVEPATVHPGKGHGGSVLRVMW